MLLLGGCASDPAATSHAGPGPALRPEPAAQTTGAPSAAPRIIPLDTVAARHAVAAWEERGCVGGLQAVTDTALRGYAQGELEAMHGWNCLARFLILLGQDEQEVLLAWRTNMEQSGLMRPELATLARGRAGVSLAMRLSPALRTGIPEHPECLSSFVSIVSRIDHPVRVLEILSELHRSDPAAFWDYFNLALAIAVVHDVPPPSTWPHSQGPAAGFGGLGAQPAPLFVHLVALDRAGKTLQPLRELGADQLKFVVDSSVGLNQLRWARLAVTMPLDDLDKLYSQIRYRDDRVRAGRLHWDGPAYTLPEIAARGGICVDQALYAAEGGKSAGVPTLLFRGRGTSGRHAWFGFLGSGGRWHRDAGRGREQRFASGIATDPQSWGDLSEQSLVMLDKSRTETPAARRARLHLEAAGCLVLAGRVGDARAAARRALAEDPRSIGAWDFLLTLAGGAPGLPKSPPEALEALCAEAAAAMQEYPDVEYMFTRRLAASLRSRGRDSEADARLREFSERVRRRRSDLGLRQETENLARELSSLPPADQRKAFEAALARHAKGSAIGAFDLLVVPFAHHLASTGRAEEARAAVRRARELLKPRKGTQLDTDLAALLAGL